MGVLGIGLVRAHASLGVEEEAAAAEEEKQSQKKQ